VNPFSIDMTRMRMMADLAGRAYCDVTTINSDATDTHVLVTETDTEIALSFEGTKDLHNFVTDGKAWRVKGDVGEVHAGFNAAFESIKDVVTLPVRGKSRKVYLGGHSLGGALATRTAQYFCLNGFQFEQVITFGEPRGGDGAYAKSCDDLFGERHIRFVNQEDIVSRIPGLLAGYRHSGHLMFMPSVGGMVLDPPWWGMALSDAWGLYHEWRDGRIALLADHGIANYQERMKRG
jgi:triacylglycerol lipase